MLVVQLLLPRFLVVEVVLFIHFVQGAEACVSKFKSRKEDQSFISKSSSCLIPLGVNGTIKEEPIFYDLDGKFLLPSSVKRGSSSSSGILIKSEAVFVSCQSKKFSSFRDKGVIEIQCRSNNYLTNSQTNAELQSQDLSCSRSIEESLQETAIRCGPSNGQGKIVHIGWRNQRGNFQPQITVCHDRSKDHTYYSNHTLYGNNIDARNFGGKKPRFREGDFYQDISADGSYKQTNQRSKILSKCHNCSFVSRGHLAPRADFIYKEWQDATYYYINAVPQWQKINGGIWASMETAVRNLASNLKRNLWIQTGAFDAIQFNGNILALGDDYRIPVPLYLWKLVYDPGANQAMVFVNVNHVVPKASLCPQDDTGRFCEENRWIFPGNRQQISSGVLQCCKYQSVKLKIPWLMELDANVGILKYSSQS